MSRRFARDWITSEEAAVALGISRSRFKDYLIDEVREKYLPNSVLITRTWLHHVKDIEKLKKYREKRPGRNRPRKATEQA